MNTTLEILAATERRLQNSIDTCRKLREILAQAERERDSYKESAESWSTRAAQEQLRAEQAERERDVAVRDRNAAQKEANKYAADLMEANGELAQLDAARAQVQRLREALFHQILRNHDFRPVTCQACTKSVEIFPISIIQRGLNGVSLEEIDRDALRDTEPHGGTEAKP